jgi:hypothetical protein
MEQYPAIVLAYLGACAAILGGLVALFNARKAVLWKRAELASHYLTELRTNPELIFACRALEWNGGRLVVPDHLCPLLPDSSKVIAHSPSVLCASARPDLTPAEIDADVRLQIYRTALDALLSWLNSVDNALERKLFSAQDVSEAGYWIQHIEHLGFLNAFMETYGYANAMQRLRRAFRHVITDYKLGGKTLCEDHD